MKKINFSVLFSHLLLAVLVTAIFLPGEKKTESPGSFLAAITLMELYYIYRLVRFPLKRESASGIISLLWLLFLIWEIAVTKLNACHPVLVPALENIFHVFRMDWKEMLWGVLNSMELLFAGVLIGLLLGTLLGLICGWNQRLKEMLSDCECIGTDSVDCLRALCNSDYADFSKCVGCGDSAWYFLAGIFEVDIVGRIYR